jgi:hypothetical protein
MVDEIGGAQAAISYAATKAGLEAGEFDVRALPAPRTFADLIYGRGGDDDEEKAMLPFGRPKVEVKIAPDSVLHLLDPGARRHIGQQVHMLQLLQQRPVVLMSPFVLTVK